MMDPANILLASQILLTLLDRAAKIASQIEQAHATGAGITDEQLALIRADVDTSRAGLVSAIDSLDTPAPDATPAPVAP